MELESFEEEKQKVFIITKEFISSITNTLKIELQNSENIANFLSKEADYRLREIILNSLKFMKNSKKTTLTCSDINHAIKLRAKKEIQSLYPSFGMVPLEKFSKKKYPSFRIDRFEFDQDSPIQSCESLINDTFLPDVIHIPELSIHWLSIAGEIPALPYNIQPPKSNKPIPKLKSIPVVNLKPVFSEEKKMYFDKISNAILNGNDSMVEIVCQTLKNDTIHSILPFLSQFIAQNVVQNLTDFKLLLHLMKCIDAIINNVHQPNVELYLHQLLPVILTCLLSHKLCHSHYESHWELRDFSANLIGLICKKYGKKYRNLKITIIKKIYGLFSDTAQPLTTHYGAIKGFIALGPQTIENYLLPNLTIYYQLLASELNNPLNPVKRGEAEHCRDALFEAARVYLSPSTKRKLKFSWSGEFLQKLTPLELPYYELLFQIFGEKLSESLKQEDEKTSSEIGEIQALLHSLQNSPDSRVRVIAAKMLGNQNLQQDPHAIDVLLDALQNDSEMDVKKNVVTVLQNALKNYDCNSETKESWKSKLGTIFEKEKDPKLQIEIKTILSHLK